MMKNLVKRKKIFYVPGMISLVFIPLLCFYHFYKIDAFTDERSIDIYIPDDSLIKEKFLSYKRDYQIISFDSSLIEENDDLKKLQLSLRKLNHENDTNNGVHIHFGKNMTYDVYIKILDIIIIEKMQTYFQYKNDFWVLVLPKPKPNKNVLKFTPITCGLYEANKDFFMQQEKERQFEYVLSLYKKYWILFLGYLGIVLINIFTLVKFNKNK